MKYYGYVYKIVVDNIHSTFNGCYYIGQHKISNKKDYYFTGSVYLRQYISKYGKQGLLRTILCKCNSLDELNKKENEFIAKLYETDAFKNGGKCLNLCAGGTNSDKNRLCTNQRISYALKGKPKSYAHKIKLRQRKLENLIRYWQGKKRSKETCEKISKINKEISKQIEYRKIISEKTKAAMWSEKVRKKYLTSLKTRKNTPWNKGKKGLQKAWNRGITGFLSNTKWWNNEIINVRAIICPDGFKPGRIKK